ncbi:MAG: UvrD-helicase domain-containing protein [Deltaproteobacteria bacterium]|nr:UvrD-helicase domain-containing protein [Deltaproteobacteria bacterium]
MQTHMHLNKNQQTAAQYKDAHILVLAGAGTGKTLTIMAHAAHLIQHGVDPGRILLLTFTRRAARDMTDRLHLSIGNAARDVIAGTFHHFCLLSMRRMSKQFGIQDFTIIDREDQTDLMKLVRADFLKKRVIFPKASELIKVYSYARNTNIGPLKYLKKHTDHDEDTMKKICEVFKEYDKRKEANRYLDYDDILHRFAKKLHDEAIVGDKLRSLYDHILVDEMQDTNPLQWLILDGLKDPAKLFCVGDDAQSIYAFRGADFRNVHSFKRRIPGAVVLRLEDNYRSSQEILDLSNWLLKESPLNYKKKLKAKRRSGEKPVLIDFETEFDEAKWIAQDLIKRHETGASWGDHMILTRTAWNSRTVEAILVEKNIPYAFIGGVGLLQAAHVKDLLCLIRASISHYDELAWIRYLTLWPKIGDITASRAIASMKTAPNIAEAITVMKKQFKTGQKIAEGSQLIQKYINEPAKALKAGARFLDPILSKRYNKWMSRKKDFNLLEQLAERYRSLLQFIETYTMDPISTTEATRPEGKDCVALITIHSAKGTESSVCYIIRAEPGMYPYIRSLGEEDEEEEERRILYVAMTRAKDELVLTRTGTQYGKTVFHGGAVGTYFLNMLPDELIESQSEWEGAFNTDENAPSYGVIRPRKRYQ